MSIENPTINSGQTAPEDDEIINDISEQLASGDEAEKERLIGRANVLLKKYHDIDQVEEQLRAEKKSPIKANKFTARKGMVGINENDINDGLKKEVRDMAAEIAGGEQSRVSGIAERLLAKFNQLKTSDMFDGEDEALEATRQAIVAEEEYAPKRHIERPAKDALK